MTNPAQIKQIKVDLKRTIRLLKKGWTRNATARNKYGKIVRFDSKSAARFCLVGALRKTKASTFTFDYIGDHIRSHIGYMPIDYFNDIDAKSKTQVIKELQLALNDLKNLKD